MRKWWYLGLAIAPVTLAGCSSIPTTISVGSGTATITWIPVSSDATGFGNPPQPFTGTIDGLPLSGVATTPGVNSVVTPSGASNHASSSNSGKIPSTIEFFRWKGTFAGKPFDVGLYATYHRSTNPIGPASFPSVKITGRWGPLAVNGHIVPPTAEQLKTGRGPVRFYGTVGRYNVSGSVPRPSGTGTGAKKTGRATFTISE